MKHSARFTPQASLPTCESKRRYVTASQAYLAMRKIRNLRKVTLRKAPVHVYRCPVCHQYHLGNDGE